MQITTLIFARFLQNFTCACIKEWRIFMHKLSQAYIVLAYGKPFITELFEYSSYHIQVMYCPQTTSVRKSFWRDVPCWTWYSRYDIEQHFYFLPRFTPVDREGLSISHFHLRQTPYFHITNCPFLINNSPSSSAYSVLSPL